MSNPSPVAPDAGEGWAQLDPAEKRARLLAAAGEVFARDGLGAPMPAIAAAAGPGLEASTGSSPPRTTCLRRSWSSG